MKSNAKPLPFVLAITAQTSARSLLRFRPAGINPAPVSPARPSEGLFLKQTDITVPTSSAPEPRSIYAVDDAPRLTELYTTLLEATGYRVIGLCT